MIDVPEHPFLPRGVLREAVPVLLATTLAACGSSDDAAPPAAEGALEVRYALMPVSEVGDAAALRTRCETEEADARARLAELEIWNGEIDVDHWYRALDSLQSSIDSVGATASSLAGVHPDEALREGGEACEQLMSSVDTDLSLSRPIYEALASIDLTQVDAATKRSIEQRLLGLRLSGIDKDAETRERIRALSERIVELGQEFDRNIREDVRTLELDSVDDLAGLPEDFVAAHAPDENGVIRITTRYPDLFPFMEYAESDEHRRALRQLSGQRGWPQNVEVFRALLEARHELARLVDQENYAALVTADKMSGSPERVARFIEELKGYTGAVQDREYEQLLARLREDQPDAERVESWQRSWVRSKVSREDYGVDSREVRRYFNYENTREGIVALVQDLFGVRIEPWDTPTWHEEVEGFELYEGDELLGRFYLDMHPRDGKFQHAAMFPFVNGIEGVQLPVAALVCNFPRGDEPMQFSQVETFLHEFGHLIHWQFAGHQDWTNLSGISTEWDFVEAPSQMLEEWVWDYDTVSRFARDADGEVLPRDLHAAMVRERDFGLGMGTRGQLAYAKISLSMYDRAPEDVDFDAIYDGAIAEMTRFEALPDTHGWAAFGHLNGYSAIYYTYQWSAAIAQDLFTRFEEAGLRDEATARAYREAVLEPGGSKPADELVADFLGRPWSVEPYAARLRGDE